jgi:hypothetical protein
MKFIILFTIFPFIALCQKKNAQSILTLHYASQKYYDKYNVKSKYNDYTEYIKPKNTRGYSYGLQYEITRRSGFLYGLGIDGGVRRYNITILQDISNFDPLAVNNLKGKYYSDTISISYNYFGGRLYAGYKININPNLRATLKIGLSFKFFTDGLSEDNNSDYIDYTLDSIKNGVKNSFNVYCIDNQKQFGSYFSPTNAYEIYIGTEYIVNNKYIKCVSAGLEFGRNWSLKANYTENLYFRTYETLKDFRNSTNVQVEKFWDQNIVMGLRFGVGI